MDLTSTKTYKRGKLLGAGTFGKVYCVERLSDRKIFAVKEVDLEKVCAMVDQPESYDLNKLLDMTRREANHLMNFSHPNIVQAFNSFEEEAQFYIVMEYCSGGNLLKDAIRKRTELFPEKQVLRWAAQLLLALSYLYDKKLMHRDIKAENVFLIQDGRLVKLGDFGLAKTVTMTTQIYARTSVGTPTHFAPEFCEGQHYTFKSEMWAFGVLLYHLTCLTLPFDTNGLYLKDVIRNHTPSPIPEEYSPELRSLIMDELLSKNPGDRPLASQLLAHRCFLGTISDLVASGIVSSAAITEHANAVGNNGRVNRPSQPMPQTPVIAATAPSKATETTAPNTNLRAQQSQSELNKAAAATHDVDTQAFPTPRQNKAINSPMKAAAIPAIETTGKPNINYQEITFHSSVHSNNVELKSGAKEAHRKNSFHAIVFSNRPVKANELIKLNCLKLETRWSFGCEIGFISIDPEVLKTTRGSDYIFDHTDFATDDFMARKFPDDFYPVNLCAHGNKVMTERGETVELKIEAGEGKITFRNKYNAASKTRAVPAAKNSDKKFWLICNLYGQTSALSISSSLNDEL